MTKGKSKITGEYFEKGDYHKALDSNWPYLPIYLAKKEYVFKFLEENGRGKKIIDLGSGEGVFVEEAIQRGFDIVGVDLNYESENVFKGSIIDLEFEENSFDMALCLDVIEHLYPQEQEKAIEEINRILKPKGTLLLTVPNLAHLLSRLTFFFFGTLIRTSTIERHKGDRPYREYIKLVDQKFKITKTKGIFPTFPIISLLTRYFPSKVIFLHKIYNFLFGFPQISFLSMLIAENK